jgi:hypothetical protein
MTYSTTLNSEDGDSDDDDAVLHPKASEPSMETSFLDTEEHTPKRPVTGRANRWLTGLKDLDAQEEKYFNTSDDELDILGKEIRASVNVASPLSKLLVDDPSHEENEVMETDLLNRKLYKNKRYRANQHELEPRKGAGESQPGTVPIVTPFQGLEADILDEYMKLPKHVRENQNQSFLKERLRTYLPVLDSLSGNERTSTAPKMRGRLGFLLMVSALTN